MLNERGATGDIVVVSYLDINHYGTTRKVSRVILNVPSDDTEFEMPRDPK